MDIFLQRKPPLFISRGVAIILSAFSVACLSAGENADDLVAGIAYFADRGSLGLVFWLHVGNGTKIAALQKGGLGLFRLEKLAEGVEKQLRGCILLAQEGVGGYVAKLREDMQGHVSFSKDYHDDDVAVRQYLMDAGNNLQPAFVQKRFQLFQQLLRVVKAGFLAFVHVDGEMAG